MTLQGYGTIDTNSVEHLRFQNNIQSIFNRVRIMYGSTPLEDIIGYNQIVRNLTEWSATNQNGTIDQTSITEGIGGFCQGVSSASTVGNYNVRQKHIQGIARKTGTGTLTGEFGLVPNGNGNGLTGSAVNVCTRRYQINLACGLLTQDKLLPVKFMASQLAIEIQLENAPSCIFEVSKSGATGSAPTYFVSNVALIPEILEFDASYGILLHLFLFFII